MNSIENTAVATSTVSVSEVAASTVKLIVTHLKQDMNREEQLGLKIKTLVESTSGNYESAGQLIGKAWKAV